MNIIIGLLSFGVGLVVGVILMGFRMPVDRTVVRGINHKADPKQWKPNYWGHNVGDFDKVVVCEKCGLHALYENAHPARPCPDCGESLAERVGKWDKKTKRWIMTK